MSALHTADTRGQQIGGSYFPPFFCFLPLFPSRTDMMTAGPDPRRWCDSLWTFSGLWGGGGGSGRGNFQYVASQGSSEEEEEEV